MRDRSKVLLTRYPGLYDAARRPYAVGRFWLGRPHDPDYGVFGLLSHETRPFLDVGANAGMSALSFRTYNGRSRIVSIEPNPFHEPDLRFASRLAKPFEYRLWGAGAADTTLTLFVPVFRGVPMSTEASMFIEEITESPSLRERLGEAMDGDEFEIVSHEVPVRRLDVLKLDPAFVKLDVQGAEHDALLGLSDTIQRSKPLLLIETPRPDVRELLERLEYLPYSYLAESNEVVPEVRGRLNTVFVHRDEPVPARRN
ncbi:FkbM family methyltransferase [Svornostia abyssi]|uniref:FkbM family methyltransferase n=1 Tax=Svornostia abyssi TaxID=2898438 RepID=A0ABY5PFS2_9ACTN|nr:FkbM family methyltransferase [Parviterribacteraceae bacterium J379]